MSLVWCFVLHQIYNKRVLRIPIQTELGELAASLASHNALSRARRRGLRRLACRARLRRCAARALNE